jgi:hypothetical protein
MSIDVISPADRTRHTHVHDNFPMSVITPDVANYTLVFDRLRSDNPRIRWPEFLGTAVKVCSGRDSEGLPPEATIRGALSLGNVQAAMTGLVNRKLIEGFQSVPDSTVGWATETEIHDYLPAAALTAYDSFRLEAAGKGTAHDGFIGLMGQGWALDRFSRVITIGEPDLLNASVDLTLLSVRELGKACRRLVVDLSWALLLQNAAMTYDNHAIFSTEHANYLTGAGSDLATALDSGMSMLAAAAAPDPEFSECPIPVGCQPKYLIVPPASLAAAFRQVRLMKQNRGDDMIVVVEPRIVLGTVAADDKVVAGKPAGWLLASPSSIAPSLLLGSLEGQGLTPIIRQFDLGGPGSYSGMWGFGADVHLDLAVCVVDWRSLVWSDGA